MTNTDIPEQAKRTIAAVTAQLNQSLIRSLFDEPIDGAARRFSHAASCPISHEIFHKVITDFVVQIYDLGLNARWKLSGDPLGEALVLLDNYYQGSYGYGYIAAALTANDPAQGGINAVLGMLKEIIKGVERQKYIRRVFTTSIEGTNWHLRCEIVRILLENYKQFLPEQMLQCEPWELVNQIPSMISGYIGSDSALEEILSCPRGTYRSPNTAHPDISSVVTAVKTGRQRRDW